MKKIIIAIFFIVNFAIVLHGQNNYKQDFLLALDKIPEIKNCEAAYNFLACKNNSCDVYKTTKTTLAKAYKELLNLQIANNASITGSTPTSMMSPDEAKKLSEQMKKMTPEERKQWAMQNAKNFLPATNVHVNKDMNNQQVTEAVQFVTKQQEIDMQDINKLPEYLSVFKEIEAKYKPRKDEVLKRFQSASGTTFDPSYSTQYILGEASEEEIAEYNKALTEYKKNIVPIYDNEMNEKLRCVIQTKQNIITKYKQVEEKIALTHYIDDAKEPSNRGHLIMGHLNVLQKVRDTMDLYEGVMHEYANQYSHLLNLEPVKKFDINFE